MRYRQLGRSGLTVSVVGVGCNAFGARIDAAGVDDVVRAALDSGVTLFDTSDSYGHGASEQLLGKALGGHRDDVIIATKFGSDLQGVQLTQNALQDHMGSWAGPLLAIILFFLAFSSIIGNYYYGETNIAFFTGRAWVLNVFRACVIGFVFLGAVAKVSLVWNLADVFSSLMATVNIIGLFLIGGVAVLLLRNYMVQKRQGLDPVFVRDDIPGLRNVECWDGTDPEASREPAASPSPTVQ